MLFFQWQGWGPHSRRWRCQEVPHLCKRLDTPECRLSSVSFSCAVPDSPLTCKLRPLGPGPPWLRAPTVPAGRETGRSPSPQHSPPPSYWKSISSIHKGWDTWILPQCVPFFLLLYGGQAQPKAGEIANSPWHFLMTLWRMP